MRWVAAAIALALPGVLAWNAWGDEPGIRGEAAPPVRDVDVDRECAQVYGSGFRPDSRRNFRPSPARARPAKGEVRPEPVFGTCFVRATDHDHEPPTGYARNDYSRRQAFNAGATRFIVQARGGAWHLYDANTLAWLRELDGPRGDAEPQWDPRDPRVLYYLPNKGGMELSRLDVESNRHRRAADFRGRLPWPATARTWTRGEGSPSADGRWWCLLAQDAKGHNLGAFSYDLQQDAIVATLPLRADVDSISASPSGRYCVVSGEAEAGGTVAWTRDFQHSRKLYDDSEHSDIARLPDGHDAYVWIDQQGRGELMMIDLDSGARQVLVPTWIAGSATSVHISGKAFERPGWVVVSTFNRKGGASWLQEQLLAVRLGRDPTVVRLGFHHARYKGYFTQPQATVSRDFSRILFNSNWDSESETDVDAYMLRLPRGFAASR